MLRYVAKAAALLLASTAIAEEVEITLADELNGDLNGYCLDISGGLGPNADPASGLQAHTCYSYRGALEVDQIFETDQFSDGTLYMPRFDVCATVTGTEVGLATCDGGETQQITFMEDGTLRPASTAEMCLTAGEDTRLGRGGTSRHQIKSLTVEDCSDTRSAYQTWRIRMEND